MPDRKGCADILYNNLDREIQRIILPLNFVQNIYFSPKYRIRDNFITPNNFLNNLRSLCGLIIFLLITLYDMFRNTTNGSIKRKEYVLETTNYYNLSMNIIGIILNFVGSIYFTDGNVSLILRVQEIHHVLKLDKRILNKIAIWNWMIITAMIVFNVTYSVSLLYTVELFNIYEILFDLMFISFDLNMIYAICMMRLIKNYVVMWLKRFEERRLGCWNLYQAYLNIIECYVIYRKVFELYIVYHLISTFLQTLTYMQMWIRLIQLCMGKQNCHNTFYPTLLIIFTCVAKNLLLHIGLSMQAQKFYVAIEDIKFFCTAQVKTARSSDSERKICKNILRLHNCSFSKIRVCGLFTVDAPLPLQLLGVITTYTIVLLQFAFTPSF